MEDKEAVKILLEMIEKYPLTEEEKEAISAGAGVLAWTSLSQSQIKARKAKKAKEIE